MFGQKLGFQINDIVTRTILKRFSNSHGKNIKYTYIYKCTCNFIIFYEVYISHYLSCTESLPGKLKHLSLEVCCCSFNQHLGQCQKFDAIHTQSYLDPSPFISHLSCDSKKSKPTLGPFTGYQNHPNKLSAGHLSVFMVGSGPEI